MKLSIRIFFLSAALWFTSCDSLLEVQPRQSIDAATALNTPEAINSNLANIYSYLKDVTLYGRDLMATAEAMSDNSRIINRAGGRYQNHGFNVANSHLAPWQQSYFAINEINLLLEALQRNQQLSPDFRDQVEGQAKTMRALLYFNLMRVFAYEPKTTVPGSAIKGGVPLILNGVIEPGQITFPSRASIDEVYRQMYQDLTDGVAKSPNSGGPHRVTKAAARALFAKVALYNEDWANAERYATDALASGVGIFVPNASYVDSWRVNNHPESILEVQFANANEVIGVNESVQSAYTTRVSLTATTLGGWGAVVPTNDFLALFQQGDVRRNLYVQGLNRSGVIATECTKYLGKSGTVYMDNLQIIRTSEVFLIRAEARARQGNASGALEDVNRIRTRAGLTAAADLTGQALLNEIILQRRLELAFEGDRWFDMKRRGQDVIKATGNVPFDDFRILGFIPIREIQVNPNLVQNIGY